MSPFPPLWQASGAPGEILQLLTNDVRRAIVRELYEAYDTSDPEHGVPFSELYDRIDCPDSGTFTYHLDELQGIFIDRVDAGYVPIVGRRRALQEILAWLDMDYDPDGPVPTDYDCPDCGDPMSVAYEGLYLRLSCDRHDDPGPTVRAQVPPRCVREWRLDELVDLLPGFLRRRTDRILSGICPVCYASIDSDPVLIDGETFEHVSETTPEAGAGGGRIAFLFHCRRCDVHTHTRPAAVALRHPEGQSFLRARGTDPLRDPLAYVLPTAAAPHLDTGTIASREPVRLETALAADGDRRTFTIDGDGVVLAVE